MSWKDESVKRILKVLKLQQECIKHVDLEDDALANQILLALLKVSTRKEEPVKLAEIVETIYGSSEKEKHDVVRLTLEKTLIRCGIVDKMYFSERDVRYFPAAYRFQEIRRIETGTGSKIEQPLGDVIEVPHDYWPIPQEFFELNASKAGYQEALEKLEEDSQQGLVDSRTYRSVKEKLERDLERVSKRLREYEAISELVSI